jgi:hypothetical protein
MPANLKSVRLQILTTMRDGFRGMSDSVPPTDPYGVTFSTVQIGPLMNMDQRKRFSMGIVAGQEREAFQMPFVMCWLLVNLELRVTVNRDDEEPGVMIEQLITAVKRFIGDNRQWSGLALDTKVKGTEIDLTTYADRSAMGVLMAEVQYRYNYNDPRSPLPALG